MRSRLIVSVLIVMGVVFCHGLSQAEIKLSGAASTPNGGLQTKMRTGDPNPGNKKLYFRLTLEKKAEVELDIYDAAGDQVGVVKQAMPAGPGTLVWECDDVPPGTFQARIKIDGVEKKSKITLVK